MCGEHKFYLGKYLPQIIDEIGSGIDFVILDTVHSMPGEALDFPVMLPYLKEGAIVILHDLKFNLFAPQNWHFYATAVVLCAVTAGEKFLNSQMTDKSQPFQYPNIGAFKVDESTRLHIENYFLNFVITWRYIPDDKQVEIYREFYKKHYPAKVIDIFNEALRMNTRTYLMAKQQQTATPPATDSLEILTYQTCVAVKGWGKWLSENRISNPPEDMLDIQAIKINFPNHKVYYQVYYNAEEGWSEEVSNEKQAGTTGKRKPIYGMRVRLDEAGSKEFDILYRVHSVNGDWTPWAKNSEVIYSHGQKINSIQIKLEPKTE